MNDFADLEPHQYEDLYAELDDPLNDVSAKTSRRLIYFGVVMVMVLVILSLVIQIPRELNIPFVLKSHNSERILQYPDQLYIQKKFVSVGDRIKKGDSLFQLTGPQVIQLIQQQSSTQSLLDIYETTKKPLQVRQLELLRNKKAKTSQFIAQAQQKLDLTRETGKRSSQSLERQIVLLQDKYERDSLLYADQVISLNDLISSESQLQNAIADQVTTAGNYTMQLLTLKNSLESFQAELNSTEYQLQSLQLEMEMEQQKLKDAIQQAENELFLVYGPYTQRGNALILHASERGIISMISNSEHSISPGDVLYRVKHAENQLYASLSVSPSDVGQMQSGQPVVLKLSSFPHYYYGTIQAEIAHVSKGPNEEGLFPIEVKLLNEGHLKDLMTTGLDGRATVILENKTVFDHVFRKVLKVATPDWA